MLKEGEFQDVIKTSQHTDPEAHKEVAEPVVGSQMSSAEEPATLAQPPQAILIAVVPPSTDTNPVQPSQKGLPSRAPKLIPLRLPRMWPTQN